MKKSSTSIFGAPLRRFAASQNGAILPIVALAMVAVIGLTGIAIDVGRQQMLQSRLQLALDTTGLALGSTSNVGSSSSAGATLLSQANGTAPFNINSCGTMSQNACATAYGQKYLNANFNNYMGSTVSNFNVVYNPTANSYTLTATATLPTTFMSVVNVNQLSVSARSVISNAGGGIELVMVLDNTGSMANPSGAAGDSSSKMAALQSAANQLVTTLFSSPTIMRSKLWIGIVPFSQTVNIGTGHPDWLDNNYDSNLFVGYTNWKNPGPLPGYAVTWEGTPMTDWGPPAVSQNWYASHPYSIGNSDSSAGYGPDGAWDGCVDARWIDKYGNVSSVTPTSTDPVVVEPLPSLYTEDLTDDPPVASSPYTLFHQYYWPEDNDNPDYQTYMGEVNPRGWNFGNNTWKWFAIGDSTVVELQVPASLGVRYGATRPAFSHKKFILVDSDNIVDSAGNATGYSNRCTANANLPGCVGMVMYNNPLNTTHEGPNLFCPQPITPMSNSQSDLTAAINGMTAQGETLINQGLEWGWNLLSPRWRGYWGGTMDANGLPLDYNTSGTNKVVVLMTDGFNTIGEGARGAYWYVSDNNLGTGVTRPASPASELSDIANGEAELDARTLSLCNSMKANGITIYTIAFGSETDADSVALMQNCASSPSLSFNALSNTDLNTAFTTIADSLNALHVSH